MKLNKFAITAAAVASLAGTAAQARYSAACFNRDEVIKMVQKRDVLSKASAECMKTYWDTHQEFFAKYHYSKYYGVRNHALDSPDKRAKAILFILWPGIMSQDDMTRFSEQFSMMTAANPKRDYPGLKDIENYLKRNNPAMYAQYIARKPSLKLEERAADERGQERGGADLRGNGDPLMQNISCVDMSRRCLEAGFNAAGMHDTFEKIDQVVLAHQVSGTEIQKGLSDLGWKVLYFNPDPTQNAAWDKDDQTINPLPTTLKPGEDKLPKWMGSWGGHQMAWSAGCLPNGRLAPGRKTGGVLCSDEYELGAEVPIPVDDKRLLVGFRTTVPEEFKKIPYFVGTAHGGYHVFPGYYGNIIEAHSVRAMSSIDNLQMSEFNPLDQERNGGPRWTDIEHYRSGVIVVPPGYLDRATANFNPPLDEEGCVDLKPRKH